jgi:glycosyltransferase involved in cell wall biosynthesis
VRIAYVCTDFGVPVFGTKGASVHVRELARALGALGHEVVLLTPRPGGTPPPGFAPHVAHLELEPPDAALYEALLRDPGAGVPVARELRALLYGSTFRPRALELLRRFRPDVVYERHSLLSQAGAALADALDVPLVVEVNAPLADEQAEHRGLAFAETARGIEREVLTGAAHVVAVSSALRAWLTELGVDPGRIVVLPNGVDAERFTPAPGDRDSVRARLGANGEPLIGFVGSLKPWHDVGGLVDAVAALRRRGRRLKLVVVGDGPQREALERRARRARIDATFTGSLEHEEVPAQLAALDVAVAPYSASDGFYFSPLKLVEYLAAGVPVVAADVGDLRHCVRSGETGWPYPPGDVGALADALDSALADRSHAQAIALAGRRHVREEHSWRANAERVVALASAGRSG